jgi:hypothetical protein
LQLMGSLFYLKDGQCYNMLQYVGEQQDSSEFQKMKLFGFYNVSSLPIDEIMSGGDLNASNPVGSESYLSFTVQLGCLGESMAFIPHIG